MFCSNILGSQDPLDLVRIDATGTCPDGRVPRWTYVRTPQVVNGWYLAVGGFAPGSGLDVDYHHFDFDRVGVVPCVSAEVPAIGT